MSTIFWLVVAYYLGRRWLRKNPASAQELKRFLGALASKRTTPHTPPTKRTGTGTARPQPPIVMHKKAEKQFREL